MMFPNTNTNSTAAAHTTDGIKRSSVPDNNGQHADMEEERDIESSSADWNENEQNKEQEGDDDDLTEPHRKSRLVRSLQNTLPAVILPSAVRPQLSRAKKRFPSRGGKVVGLKDAGTLSSSWKARRKEFLVTSGGGEPTPHMTITRMNASSTDTIYGPMTTNVMTIEEKEKQARALQNKNPLLLLYLGNLAALKVMIFYLISLETLITCTLTAGLTVYWYNVGLEHENDNTDWTGSGMDFIILAFAVTSPIATALGMAFTRREGALVMIAEMRSSAHQLYLAHCLWDWPENGGRAECRTLDFQEHCDAVMAQLVGIGDELSRFLTLPTTSRSRHRMTKQGRREAARTIEVAYRLLESMVTQRMTRLSIYAERLKAAGLPSGEVSRIRQYERYLQTNIERLRMYKMYRTPQALRSFARIFVFLLPPFYAPKFAQVAIDLHSLAVGIGFGMITAIGLTALFESLQVLEDPFVGYLALDGIDVREEFEVLLWSTLVKTRRMIFPDAPSYPVGRRCALDVDSVVHNHDLTHHTRPSSIQLVPASPPPPPPPPSSHAAAAAVSTTNSSSHYGTASSRRDLHATSIGGGPPNDDADILFVDPGPMVPDPVHTAPSEVSLLTTRTNSLLQDRDDDEEVGAEFGYPLAEDDPELEDLLRQTNFRSDGEFTHHKRSNTASSVNNMMGLIFRSNAALPSQRTLNPQS